MTRLPPNEVAGVWVGAGGPQSRAAEWLAIAIGESGLDDTIVSPAGAIGLWQIMPFNAALNGFTVGELYDPRVNARVAVLMSGGGTNCAAWDSCYRDIYASGRYTHLAWPEVGSRDYNLLPTAAAELGGAAVNPISTPSQPGVDGTLAATIAAMQRTGGQLLPAQTNTVTGIGQVIGGLFR